MRDITTVELEHLKLKMKSELASLISDVENHFGPEVKLSYVDAGGDGDSGDEAAANLVIDTQNALMKWQLEKVNDLTAAIKRIESNVYGICIDCSETISVERLTAYPTAKRCIKCQQLKEMTSLTSTKT